MNMKKILIPTDFSTAATNAFFYAYTVFGSEAEYQLFHSYNEPHGAGTSMISITDILEENAVNEMKQHLGEIRAMAEGPLNIITEVQHGETVESIVRFAELHDADMIVMGTTGASGFKAYFMGSNASAVLYNAHCPVITVPAVFRNHQFNNLTIAVQPDQLDSIPIPTILKEAILSHGCQLKALVVNEDADADASTAADFGEITELSDQHHANDTNAATEAIQIETERVIYADAKQAIELFVDTDQSNGVILFPGQSSRINRLFNPSLSRKLSHHLNVPVIALRNHT